MPERNRATGPALRESRTGRRVRAAVFVLAGLVVLAVLLKLFAGAWTDWLWFRALHYPGVFRTRTGAETVLFAVFGALMAAVVGGNLFLAHRLRPLGPEPEPEAPPAHAAEPAGDGEEDEGAEPPQPRGTRALPAAALRFREALAPHLRPLVIGLAAVAGLLTGASAAGQWKVWLLFRNGQPFGQRDPQFHRDASFYTFTLPWYRFLLDFGFAAVLTALAGAAVVHYLYGGLRIPTRMHAPGPRTTPAAQAHLCLLLGAFTGLKAIAYWLDRYALAVRGSGAGGASGWTGLHYVDANAYLPAKTILMCIAAVCALLFFAGAVRRTAAFPLVGLGLMALSAILVGGLYPAIVQRFTVRPNIQTAETPYIQKNIDATRFAFNLQGARVDKDYDVRRSPDPKELKKDAASVSSIRLLDPEVASSAFSQLQQFKGYYSFPKTLDVDRYKDNSGTLQDTVLGVRELDLDGVPGSQRNWVNQHFTYTHGYGLVAARSSSTSRYGEPEFVSQGLPAADRQEAGSLGKYQPRIYFGERTSRYSVVGGKGMKEIDYSDNSGQHETTYRGSGGVQLGGPLTRAAFALRFAEPKLLYSGAIKPGAQILFDRTPIQRVQRAAPWLKVDDDPYPAVIDGRIQWILDGYTTSNSFPYSTRTELGGSQVNYARNSVKATVDAYTGQVRLYQWDKQDPVLKSWMHAFPGTVRPASQIPAALRAHLRYPTDLFTAQRTMLTRYHVTDARAYFNGGDTWRIPDNPTVPGHTPVRPTYQTVRMPGRKQAAYSLTTPFVPINQNGLAAFMAVDSEPGPDYGRIRILQMPPAAANTATHSAAYGPQQVQSLFTSNDQVSKEIYSLHHRDGRVLYGDLLTLPVGGGLLYVEPVYVTGSTSASGSGSGSGSGSPVLRRVLAVYGNRTEFRPDLESALTAVLGSDPAASGPPPTTTVPGKPGHTPSKSADAQVRRYLDEARAAMADADRARKSGDWAAFGEAQHDAQQAIENAIRAQGPAKKKR